MRHWTAIGRAYDTDPVAATARLADPAEYELHRESSSPILKSGSPHSSGSPSSPPPQTGNRQVRVRALTSTRRSDITACPEPAFTFNPPITGRHPSSSVCGHPPLADRRKFTRSHSGTLAQANLLSPEARPTLHRDVARCGRDRRWWSPAGLCVLLASLGFILTSCGGSHGLTYAAPAKAVLGDAQTGARVVCRKGQHSVTGIVPAPGHGVRRGLGLAVELTRHRDGSLAVVCGSLPTTGPR